MPKKKTISLSSLPTLEEASTDPLGAIEAWKERLEKSDAAYHKTLNRGLGVLFASSTAILSDRDLKKAFVAKLNAASLRDDDISLPLEDDEFFRLVPEYVFMNTQSPNRASKYGRVLDMLWLRDLSIDEAARALSEAGVEKLYLTTTSELPVKGLSKVEKRAARKQFQDRHADDPEDVSDLINRASAYRRSIGNDDDKNRDPDDVGSAKTLGSNKSTAMPKSIDTVETIATKPEWDDDDLHKMRLPVGGRVARNRETLHVEMKSADLARVLTGGRREFAMKVWVSEPAHDGWIFVRAIDLEEIIG